MTDKPLAFDWESLTRASLRELSRRVRRKFAPPQKMGITEWANRYRYLAAESADLSGKYSASLTPWVPGIHAALDDPAIWKVVCMKSAQIAWTDGVINNWLGRIIDIEISGGAAISEPVYIIFGTRGALTCDDADIRLKYLDPKKPLAPVEAKRASPPLDASFGK